MTDSDVQGVFRRAIETNDAPAMRQGLELLLGLDEARGALAGARVRAAAR